MRPTTALKTSLAFCLLALSITLRGQNDIYIPDNNLFQELVSLGMEASPSEVNTIKYSSAINLNSLNVNNKGIQSMEGIEGFVNLTELRCSNNQLSGELHLAGLDQLRKLYCDKNNLKYITGIACLDLTHLDCGQNNLQILEVGNMTSLVHLYCDINSLDYLDVAGLINLKQLRCNGNQISKLQVTAMTGLTHLFCFNNKNISELELTLCSNLLHLNCSNTDVKELDVSNTNKIKTLRCNGSETKPMEISTLDLDGMADLEILEIAYNQFTELELLSEDHPKLEKLVIAGNDFSHNQFFTETPEISCGEGLKRLDLRGFTQLSFLDLQLTGIEHVDARETALVPFASNSPYLNADQNPEIVVCLSDPDGAELDPRFIKDATGVWCNCEEAPDPCLVNISYLIEVEMGNPYFNSLLVNLDNNGDGARDIDLNEDGWISKCEADLVTGMTLISAGMSSIDGIEYFPNLESVNFSLNDLQSEDLSKNTKLTSIIINDNSNLTSLNLSGLDLVSNLRLNSNALFDGDEINNTGLLGLSTLEALVTFHADNNHLVNLDMSSNQFLVNLQVSHNDLTSLEVVHNSNLVNLGCSYNLLTTLDLSDLVLLYHVHCKYNLLTTLDVRMPSATIEDPADLGILAYDYNFLGNANTPQIDQGLLGLNDCQSLATLHGQHNELVTLDLTGIQSLVNVEVNNNLLTDLSVSPMPNLVGLSCGKNRLEELNLLGCGQLANLACSANKNVNGEYSLHTVHVEGLDALSVLDLSYSILTMEDYSNPQDPSGIVGLDDLTSLTSLNVEYNDFQHIDFSQLIALTHLRASNNYQVLSFSLPSGIQGFSFGRSDLLESIDLSGFQDLETVQGINNPALTAMDIRNTPSLISLTMFGCTSLDVICSDHASIETLSLEQGVTELDNCDGLRMGQENQEEYREVYPNPSTQGYTMTQNANVFDVEILDAQGRSVGAVYDYDSFGQDLDPGVYFLRITSEDGSELRRLIKE